MSHQAPAGVRRFFSSYPILTYQKGVMIAQSGQKMDTVFMVLDGKIRQFDVTKNGNEVTLNTYQSPSILSLSWLFGSYENRYALQSMTTSHVAAAPIEDFKVYLESDCAALLSILERVSLGLEGFLSRLSVHMGGRSDRRIAIEIVLYAHRFGRIAADTSCTIGDLTVNELAASCGIARETASRQLKVLRSKGLLDKQGTSILIPNIIALEEFAFA